MANKWPGHAGPNDVPSYQLSGVPFVTSSNGAEATATPVRVEFPYTTRFFVVSETAGQKLRVGFTEAGVNALGGLSSSIDGESTANRKNYFVLAANSTTEKMEIRCKELWFRRDGAGGTDAGFSIMAGMTPIPGKNFPVLTGSNSYDGVG